MNNKTIRFFICFFLAQLLCNSAGVAENYFFNVPLARILMLFGCIAIIFMTIQFISFGRDIFRNARLEASVKNMEKQQKLEFQHLEAIENQKEATLRFQADFQKKLMTLDTLLESGNYSDAAAYTKEITENFENTRYHSLCNDQLIDAILGSKNALAVKHGIRTNYQVLLPENHEIQPSDLCCIFFNLLDNGMEACINSGEAPPTLTLTAGTKADFLTIHMENTKNPAVSFRKGTSGKNSPAHGFGLSIIEEISRKYDGVCEWNDKGCSFESTVVLRFRQNP